MESLRDKAEQAVYAMLDKVGVPDDQAIPGARLLDIMVDEDATFWFIPGVERLLAVKVPHAEWERVYTVGETIEMLERHLLTLVEP